MYGLSCLCLSAAERRRLDGFQNRCLCHITGIPPSFISRVPNTAVLHRARCSAASDMLVQRQMLLFGKVLRSPLDHPMHVSAFIPGSLQPATSRYVRRVGRPRREWVSEVRSSVFQHVGGHREVTRLVHDPSVWYRAVRQAIPVHARRMTD